MPTQRVLVVDDEPTVRSVVSEYLRRDGYEVRELDRADTVEAEVTAFAPDLVILDIMLPGGSGLDLLRNGLVERAPVILLTALGEETDRVLGLEFGADDYVAKPFSPRELVARVKSVLRRSQSTPNQAGQNGRLEFDGLTIDTNAREVFVDDKQVDLTAREFDVLAFLAATPRRVYSRAQLLTQVWDSSPEFQDPATVTVHVRRIRSKIEADPENPRWITTSFGVGYRFEP